MKDGRAFALDQLSLYQLFGLSGFYATLPRSAMETARQAQDAHREALEMAMGGANCPGCSTLRSIITPAQNLLGRSLAVAQLIDPEALEPLAIFISDRKGYRPRPITLHFRDEQGRTKVISF